MPVTIDRAKLECWRLSLLAYINDDDDEVDLDVVGNVIYDIETVLEEDTNAKTKLSEETNDLAAHP